MKTIENLFSKQSEMQQQQAKDIAGACKGMDSDDVSSKFDKDDDHPKVSSFDQTASTQATTSWS